MVEESDWRGHKCRRNIEIGRGEAPFCDEHKTNQVISEWKEQKRLKAIYKKKQNKSVSDPWAAVPLLAPPTVNGGISNGGKVLRVLRDIWQHLWVPSSAEIESNSYEAPLWVLGLKPKHPQRCFI